MSAIDDLAKREMEIKRQELLNECMRDLMTTGFSFTRVSPDQMFKKAGFQSQYFPIRQWSEVAKRNLTKHFN